MLKIVNDGLLLFGSLGEAVAVARAFQEHPVVPWGGTHHLVNDLLGLLGLVEERAPQEAGTPPVGLKPLGRTIGNGLLVRFRRTGGFLCIA